MKLNRFLETLRAHTNKALLFEYQEGNYAGANYHITEVKNVDIHSVDCRGKSNAWKETVIQLWESPAEIGKREYMTVDKAVQIFDRVDSINPLWLDTEVKIEYGNAHFHTAVMTIHNMEITEDAVIIQLFVTATQCKASTTCGIQEPKETAACC
jgi:hypothetical protein